jgi:MFS transporter, FHS family, L-fucose permease
MASEPMRNRVLIIGYILCVWFVISFVTNIIGPLMPTIIADFGLSLGLAGVLPFSFFLAYGVISIPAGILVERYGARTMLLSAFGLNLSGALAIAAMPGYAVVIAGLFVIGLGMAMLQVVINPLTRTVGGEAHFAFFSVMGQLVFGLASFLSPLAFAALMQSVSATEASGAGWLPAILRFAPADLPWVAFYGAFVLIFVLVITITRAIPIPDVELKEEERAGPRAAYWHLLGDKHVRLFFLGIVAYVGTEQSLANWMSQFLSTYHDMSPTVEGAHAVATFWGLMSVGCVLGLVLLRLLDSRIVLVAFSSLAILCIALALFASARVAAHAFAASGFFLSVMFSVIFSLALNSVPRHHGAFSGILCTGILGGALLPLAIGMLGDWIGLRLALTLLFFAVGYILSIGLWARPLVGNETIDLTRRRKVRQAAVNVET